MRASAVCAGNANCQKNFFSRADVAEVCRPCCFVSAAKLFLASRSFLRADAVPAAALCAGQQNFFWPEEVCLSFVFHVCNKTFFARRSLSSILFHVCSQTFFGKKKFAPRADAVPAAKLFSARRSLSLICVSCLQQHSVPASQTFFSQKKFVAHLCFVSAAKLFLPGKVWDHDVPILFIEG